jgi:hypothetical protein
MEVNTSHYENARQIIDDLIDYNIDKLSPEANGKLDRIWTYLRAREVSEIVRMNGFHGQPPCGRSVDFSQGNGFD